MAVKKIFRSLLHADAMREFQAEADILGHLRHPNIVLFMVLSLSIFIYFIYVYFIW